MAANEVAKLAAVIDLNTKRLDNQFKVIHGNFKQAETNTQKFKASLGAISAIGATALLAAIGALHTFNKAAEEATMENKKLGAVLLSTGYAAGFVADELVSYASELQDLTGINDEVIKGGMAVLATFTNVRDEAFKETTLAALNMSAVLGQDLNNSVMQLGKALQDPIKGVTALRRVGVAFTEAQKEQITTLIRTGDVLSAQKIILAEVTREFGGAAAATKTNSKVIATAIDDIKESLGKLFDTENKFSKWIANSITGFRRLIDVVTLLSTETKNLTLEQAKTKLASMEEQKGVFELKSFTAEKQAIKERIALLEKEAQMAKNASKEQPFSIATSGKDKKTALEVANDRAALIKQLSDLEIAQNNYTAEQMLQKQIEIQGKVVQLYQVGITERYAALTELINLEKELENTRLDNKQKSLEQEYAQTSIYKQMDLLLETNSTQMTEQQKVLIEDKARLQKLQSEVRLQQQILELKRRGVDDLSKLNDDELKEYNDQLTKKLEAELAYQEALADIKKRERDESKQTADAIAGYFGGAYRGLIDGSMSAGEAFREMLIRMGEDMLRSGISSMLMSFLTGGFAQSGFGGIIASGLKSVFGGFRADGGSVSAGSAYVVGEKRPELFVPNTSGRIIPEVPTSSGQSEKPVIITNQINIRSLDGKDAYNVLMENKQAIQKMISDGIQFNQTGLRNVVKAV